MNFYTMTDTTEAVTQITDQLDEATERLDLCVLGNLPGLKMQKQNAYLFYCVAICFCEWKRPEKVFESQRDNRRNVGKESYREN